VLAIAVADRGGANSGGPAVLNGGRVAWAATGRPHRVAADPEDVTATSWTRSARGAAHVARDLADSVARRLVAAEIEEDPERAYAQARAARELAARVGLVREAAGSPLPAGKWAEALSELRAARRLTAGRFYCP